MSVLWHNKALMNKKSSFLPFMLMLQIKITADLRQDWVDVQSLLSQTRTYLNTRWPAEEMLLLQRCTCSVPLNSPTGAILETRPRFQWFRQCRSFVYNLSDFLANSDSTSAAGGTDRPAGMWRRTTKEKPQVNTTSLTVLFENKKGDVLYLFYCEPIVSPPSVSCCYPISIACAERFSHVHTIITLHFQPSQSHKYLVYRLLMFIQSTGLHCLGTIARQGPFRRKKKTIPNEK